MCATFLLPVLAGKYPVQQDITFKIKNTFYNYE